MAAVPFNGNCPRLAPKEAKYSIRWRQGQQVVSLVYRLSRSEVEILSTDRHDELILMVNTIKEEFANATGGAFYINEWHQVIVPVSGRHEYYYAGEYHNLLEFEFEGRTLSGKPVGWDNQPLRPGELWGGPHPGIPYKLRAGGRDIYYELQVTPTRIRTISLSEHVGKEAAQQMAARIRAVKSDLGGRFYVNEWRAIFAPLAEENLIKYVYVGQLEEGDPWFAKPVIEYPSREGR